MNRATKLAAIGILLHSAASADTLSLTPLAAGYGVDGGEAGGWVLDGTFDTLGPAGDVYIRKWRSLDFTRYVEFRGAYEYELPDATQLQRGDVAPVGAPDGQIDGADVLLISRKAAGQSTAF